MGLHLHTWLYLSHLGRRTARFRQLLALLRTLPCPTRAPLTPSRHTCTCALPVPAAHTTRIGTTGPKLAGLKRGGFGWLAGDPRGHAQRRRVKWLLFRNPVTGRGYSSSGPGSGREKGTLLKGGAPIGVLEEGKSALPPEQLGSRLRESFQYLSRHINAYFNRPDTPTQAVCGRAGLGREEAGLGREEAGRGREEAGPVRIGKRLQREGLANERAGPGPEGGALGPAEVREASANRTEDTPPDQSGEGVQLFHISSFATRLGESYSYVARHINSAFSASVARDTPHGTVTDTRMRRMRRRRRRRAHSRGGGGAGRSGPVRVTEAAGTRQDPAPMRAEDPTVWDDIYLHFARRINSYFGATVTDPTPEPAPQSPLGTPLRSVATGTQGPGPAGSPTDSAQGLQGPAPAANHEAEPLWHRSPGLFHMSNLATSFGESYAQMAHHVNRYFKGQGSAEEGEEEAEEEGEEEEGYTSGPPQGRTQSFIQEALSDLLGAYMGGATPTTSPTGTMRSAQSVAGRRWAEEKTRVLVSKLQQAASPTSLNACIEELNEHLVLHPACTALAWQEKAVASLLALRRFHGDNRELQDAMRETLALIGYVDSVKGRGIRILSIDGGGTRGVVPLQVLKRVEAATGRHVHQLFDYICGVSTGAVLAFMLGLMRVPLQDCEEMYRRFGSDVFRQNPLVGTVKMGWSHSYYNTPTWENILREKMGTQVLIKTARSQLCPKVAAVSAVVNWGTVPRAFVFRNYNHAPGRLSRYAGASGYQLWQAIRASTAAPGYFQEFPLSGDIHQDGALILNNPCALAVHECRLLWPTRPFQCVLSLGTGRYDNAKRGPVTATSLRTKISSVINSATDTEGVHTLLDDLLSPDTYFRLNPPLSAEVAMDERRAGALDLLRADTQRYLDRNQHKLERLGGVLGRERGSVQRAGDWVRDWAWELRQRWT